MFDFKVVSRGDGMKVLGKPRNSEGTVSASNFVERASTKSKMDDAKGPEIETCGVVLEI